MTFADIPGGATVFLDANTFIYHFTSQASYGAACTSLLERVEHCEIEGWTSPFILAELSHRLMTIEACTLFQWPFQGIAARLRNHPQQLQQLGRFRDALIQTAKLGLHMVAITDQHVVQAADLSCQFGLLTNDALILALMQAHGLGNLASNDGDFDRVPGLTRFAPNVTP
jgi:predicted nucleic acid-binding protein